MAITFWEKPEMLSQGLLLLTDSICAIQLSRCRGGERHCDEIIKLWGWILDSVAKSDLSSRGPGLIPRTHRAVHNCLLLPD